MAPTLCSFPHLTIYSSSRLFQLLQTWRILRFRIPPHTIRKHPLRKHTQLNQKREYCLLSINSSILHNSSPFLPSSLPTSPNKRSSRILPAARTEAHAPLHSYNIPNVLRHARAAPSLANRHPVHSLRCTIPNGRHPRRLSPPPPLPRTARQKPDQSQPRLHGLRVSTILLTTQHRPLSLQRRSPLFHFRFDSLPSLGFKALRRRHEWRRLHPPSSMVPLLPRCQDGSHVFLAMAPDFEPRIPHHKRPASSCSRP